jgi:hypothetical protein
MRKFYITKDKDGFKYSENVYMGWNRCPDRVQDRASLLKFLTSEGRYDDPLIVFSDKNGKPAKLYEVKRGNGHIVATVDGYDKLPLTRQHFLSDSEAGDFFKLNEHSERVIKQAEKLQPAERLQYYQNNATEVVKDEFDTLLRDKLSDISIKSYLEGQAKIDNMGAEIIFK